MTICSILRITFLKLLLLTILLPIGVGAAQPPMNSAIKGMFLLNLKLKRIVKERRKLEDKKSRSLHSIQKLNKSIDEKSQKKDKHQSFLVASILDRKKRNKETLLELMLASKSSAAMERQAKTIEVISQYQSILVRDYLRDLQLMNIQRAQVEKEINQLATTEKKLKFKEAEIYGQLENKSSYLGNLRKSKKSSLLKLASIRKKGDSLFREEALSLERVLSSSALYELRGRLELPVVGNIRRPYGDYTDEKFSVQVPHSGLFIEAPEGASVKAISDGSVIFQDELPGLGQTLVIDHGDHFFSVYSVLSRSLASVGAKVARNQIIAAAGSSLSHNAHGIYFEIRHFSEPMDPAQWIKREDTQ